MKKMKRGFTLVELMVVIGILALLLSITLVAINPSRQFAKANNSKRQNDIVQLSDAIYQNITQNKGIFSSGGSPFVIPLTPAMIASGGAADICTALVTNYIPALPQDPSQNNGAQISNCGSYNTGYQIVRLADGRITITAPSAQAEEVISVTR